MTPASAAWLSRAAALILPIHARSRLMKIIRPMTPLRQRMLEDMQIRNYSPHTIDGYLRYVAQFAKHFHRSPDLLDAEHIRTYQLHLLHTQVVTFHAQRVVIFTNYWVKPHKGTRSVIASDLEDKFSEIN